MNTETVQTQTGTKSEIEPYLKDVYETYCLWKSLPAIFKYPPPDKKGIRPNPKDFAEQMGIDDENIISLVEIRTQTEFMQRFSLGKNTLTQWNKTIGVRNTLDDMRQWAKFLSKNVLTALYNKAIRKGDSFEVKLWFQLIEGFQEKATLKHELGDINFNIILNKKDASQLGANNSADRSVGEAMGQNHN